MTNRWQWPLVCLSILGVGLGVLPLGADFHLSLACSQTSKAVTQNSSAECWLTPQAVVWVSQKERRHYRPDLTWRLIIYPDRKEYVQRERPLAAKKHFDMHKAGYEMEADFDWEISAVGNRKIADYPCLGFLANGDADFAEAQLTIWLTENHCLPEWAAQLCNGLLLDLLKNRSARTMAQTILKNHSRFLLISWEWLSTLYSPEKRSRSYTVVKISEEPCPNEILSIPASYQKISANEADEK